MKQDMVTFGLESLLVCEEVQERTVVYYILSFHQTQPCWLRKSQSGVGFCSTEQSAFKYAEIFICTPTPLMLRSPAQLRTPQHRCIRVLVTHQGSCYLVIRFFACGFVPLVFLSKKFQISPFSKPGLQLVNNRWTSIWADSNTPLIPESSLRLSIKLS